MSACIEVGAEVAIAAVRDLVMASWCIETGGMTTGTAVMHETTGGMMVMLVLNTDIAASVFSSAIRCDESLREAAKVGGASGDSGEGSKLPKCTNPAVEVVPSPWLSASFLHRSSVVGFKCGAAMGGLRCAGC